MKHFHMDPQVRVCFWRFYGQFCSSFLFSFLFSSLIFKSWGKEEENSRQKGPWSGVVGVITLLFTADIQHWPLVLPAGMLLFFPESWLRGHSEWSRQTRVGSNQQSSFNEEWNGNGSCCSGGAPRKYAVRAVVSGGYIASWEEGVPPLPSGPNRELN